MCVGENRAPRGRPARPLSPPHPWDPLPKPALAVPSLPVSAGGCSSSQPLQMRPSLVGRSTTLLWEGESGMAEWGTQHPHAALPHPALPGETKARIPQMLSIPLPASVTPPYPSLCHADRVGEQKGLEVWGHLEALVALQWGDDGVLAPAAPQHRGVPVLGWRSPVGWCKGMLSARHRSTLCFTLLHQDGGQGLLPGGVSPRQLPSDCCGRPLTHPT